MRYLAKTKIGKLHPKRSKVYPMIRLPERCLDIVGEIVQIYAIKQNDVSGFLITLEKEARKEESVAQLLAKVAQPRAQNDIRSRLLALELEIRELKLVIQRNESSEDNLNEKGIQKDGLGRIRTGDLRHVKAGNLAFILTFSDRSALFSDATPSETTMRKASAPS
jgi:hypothetical protein